MKKIFTALTFALCIIFSATAFAEEAEDIVAVATDSTNGNRWYMDSTDVTIEKNSGGELICRANFVAIFSDEGKKEIISYYRTNGQDVPGLDSIAFCIETLHFREAGGKLYFAPTDMLVYNQNKEAIKELGYIDRAIEWQTINKGSLGEIMYQTARKYAK